MKIKVLLLATGFICINNAYAKDANFEAGKQLFQDNCLKCHGAQIDPPKAPPMFGVQKKYKMISQDRDDFIQRLTSFATNPSKEKAILKGPVKMLGVMPQQHFNKDDVRKIAAYLYDETFAPPCNHLKHAMKRLKKSGQINKYNKHKQHYNKLCKQNSPIEEGSLKMIMQQLGEDYAALNHAILTEDYSSAETAAHAIAYHDKPSMGAKMKLMASLRSEMKNFKTADGKVHNLAKELEAAAKNKNLHALIQKQSHMLKACMACHTVYRSRVIGILK